jgi:DNA-binding NarL/FixJ family response regulator
LQGQVLHVRAFVAAHRAQADEARAAAKQLLEVVERSGNERLRARYHAVLGFLELSVGDPAAADVELSRAGAVAAAAGHVEPCVLRFHHNHVEALVELRELARAEELVEFLEGRAGALRTPWIVAAAARGRGLVAGAHGDISAAELALEEALQAHERLADPFERARTLLAFGAVQRRAKRKRAARNALDEALERFERLGAPLWADRARAELARIGGRTASGHRLTPTEQRVAQLVGKGRSNKEVAAALFVTPRTVEKSLSRIYAKLGVRSRTELAHKLSGLVDVSKV